LANGDSEKAFENFMEAFNKNKDPMVAVSIGKCYEKVFSK
jgi:hypothetical protein